MYNVQLSSSLTEIEMPTNMLHNLIALCVLFNYSRHLSLLKVGSVPILPSCQQDYCSLGKTRDKTHIFLLQTA